MDLKFNPNYAVIINQANVLVQSIGDNEYSDRYDYLTEPIPTTTYYIDDNLNLWARNKKIKSLYFEKIGQNFKIIQLCPSCQSFDIIKYGKTDGNQRYYCKDCNRSFTGNRPGRPKEDDEILIKIPVAFWQTLKAIAKDRGISPSEYLQDILTKEFEE